MFLYKVKYCIGIRYVPQGKYMILPYPGNARLEACGAPDGFGGAAGASLLYSLRTEGGLFEVRFTMDGLYTAQVRADAAEKALQILAALAAQSPESGGKPCQQRKNCV